MSHSCRSLPKKEKLKAKTRIARPLKPQFGEAARSSPESVSRSLGFLHALELGLELFTRVFVVDTRREPNVIERQLLVGVRQRIALRFDLLLIDFDESDADDALLRGLGPEVNGNAVIVSHMTRSRHQDRTVGMGCRNQALGHLSISGALDIHHRSDDSLGWVAAMSIAYISRHTREHGVGWRTIETELAHRPRIEGGQAIP